MKLWQRLHLRTSFSCSYKTFIASLIAIWVVAKGMASMAGFHATIVVTVDLAICSVQYRSAAS